MEDQIKRSSTVNNASSKNESNKKDSYQPQFVSMSPNTQYTYIYSKYKPIIKEIYRSKQRVQTANNQNGPSSQQSLNGMGTQPSTYVENSALERLKNIQSLVKRNWHGVSVEHSGKPGMRILFLTSRYCEHREQEAVQPSE